ncbi:MAG: type II toxin-antitoxin system VapC family toxin [Acidobacteriota bacterium]
MIYVFDSSAMIAFVRKEPGEAMVWAILSDRTNTCFAHSVNLCEVYYDFHRSHGAEVASHVIEDLYAAGVRQRNEIDDAFWQKAGSLKSVHRRVSLADCFAITLAQQLNGSVLTSDHHEFDAIATQGVCNITFIR